MAKKKKISNVVTKSAPAAVGTKKGPTKQPVIRFNPDGSCLVSHSEYVSDINTGSATTYSSTFAVNPQRTATFPWLSAIATRFEMYKFSKLAFHYRPSTGTSTDGWIALGFDFDFYDEAPSKSAMLAWKYSSKSAVWQACNLSVSPDARLSSMRYCNYAPTNGDARLDMLGNLWLLVETPSSLTIGELFIEYEVEFRQPSLRIPPSLYLKASSTAATNNSAQIFSNGMVAAGNALFQKISDSTITLYDVGEFLVSYYQHGAGQTTEPYASFATPSGSPGAEYVSQLITRNKSSTGNPGSYLARLKVNVPPVNITVGNTTGDGGVQLGELRVATYAYATS